MGEVDRMYFQPHFLLSICFWDDNIKISPHVLAR